MVVPKWRPMEDRKCGSSNSNKIMPEKVVRILFAWCSQTAAAILTSLQDAGDLALFPGVSPAKRARPLAMFWIPFGMGMGSYAMPELYLGA